MSPTDVADSVIEQALSWPDKAKQLIVVDDVSYTRAGELLQGIKALRKEVDGTFDPIIRKQHEAHREACAQKKRAETPLAEAENILKQALVRYDNEQERIRRVEEARLRELARAEEEERRVREAAELEAQANATVDLVEAFEIRQEAEAIIEAPIRAPIVQVQKATPRVAGLSFREKWDAVVVDKLKLVQHVAAHPELIYLLDVNPTNLRKLAEFQKDKLALPGAQPRMEKIASSRAS